jgi:hypothetical protein
MKDIDKKRFSEVMLTLAEACSASISKEGLKVRFLLLKDFPIQEVEYAALQIINSWKRAGCLPTHAEFIEVLGASRPKLEDVAAQRVNEIMGQIRAIGSYGCPKWDDPVVDDLLRHRWSWQSLCAMTETEHKWFAKEFIEAYRSASKNSITPLRIEAKANVMKLVENIGGAKC